ncbi:MAG TPA: thioredoxin domain-containing protein [Gemmatimonadales bacterium]|nr:thioredoxin domain-containing protein [Gemmatimonadales bacterium]
MASKVEKISVRSGLDVVTSLVLIAAASTLIYRNTFGLQSRSGASLAVPSTPLSIDGAPLRGSEHAAAVMIVFSDFECPFCTRFAREVLPEIQREYVSTGKLALAFRHLPLASHPHAMLAAVSAECAGQQGRFWEMHDFLYTQDVLAEDTLRTPPASLNLDSQRFSTCLLDPAVNKSVRAAADEANRLGVRGTPSFFFGKRHEDGRVKVARAAAGALPTSTFREHIDAVLAGAPARWWAWVPFLG